MCRNMMMKLVFLTAFVMLGGVFFLSSQAITCYKCDDCKETDASTETCTKDDPKASCQKTKYYSLSEGQLIFSFCHLHF